MHFLKTKKEGELFIEGELCCQPQDFQAVQNKHLPLGLKDQDGKFCPYKKNE